MDDEGRYVDGNPAICELLGCSHDDLVKMSVWDVTPLPERERIPELLDAFRSAGTLSGEYTLLCKGGATRDVEYRSVANIQPGLHLGVHTDITDRKRSAAALRESEERFRFLAESIAHMVWAVSPDGNVDYYNRRLLEYLGVTTEQVQGQKWAETVHPDDRRTASRPGSMPSTPGPSFASNTACATGGPGNTAGSSGTPFPNATPRARSSAGTVPAQISMNGCGWRKSCAAATRPSRMPWRASPVGHARAYVSVNPAYAGMLGHSAWELIGRDWQTTVCPQDLEKAGKPTGRCRKKVDRARGPG